MTAVYTRPYLNCRLIVASVTRRGIKPSVRNASSRESVSMKKTLYATSLSSSALSSVAVLDMFLGAVLAIR